MRRSVSAPAGVRLFETTTSYSYPQIPGYQDPARLDNGPLIVRNPEPGSEAEKVRDEAVPSPKKDGGRREKTDSTFEDTPGGLYAMEEHPSREDVVGDYPGGEAQAGVAEAAVPEESKARTEGKK
ncbi:hypothetical protein SLS53_001508 [Cytospora paraplurivora]|uniref:Uncharacterized protein n=1 Tax=Cytospora paraplurivora TaxID=2898453 RepID=A0AAN9UFS6_9PEZI